MRSSRSNSIMASQDFQQQQRSMTRLLRSSLPGYEGFDVTSDAAPTQQAAEEAEEEEEEEEVALSPLIGLHGLLVLMDEAEQRNALLTSGHALNGEDSASAATDTQADLLLNFQQRDGGLTTESAWRPPPSDGQRPSIRGKQQSLPLPYCLSVLQPAPAQDELDEQPFSSTAYSLRPPGGLPPPYYRRPPPKQRSEIMSHQAGLSNGGFGWGPQQAPHGRPAVRRSVSFTQAVKRVSFSPSESGSPKRSSCNIVGIGAQSGAPLPPHGGPALRGGSVWPLAGQGGLPPLGPALQGGAARQLVGVQHLRGRVEGAANADGGSSGPSSASSSLPSLPSERWGHSLRGDCLI